MKSEQIEDVQKIVFPRYLVRSSPYTITLVCLCVFRSSAHAKKRETLWRYRKTVRLCNKLSPLIYTAETIKREEIILAFFPDLFNAHKRIREIVPLHFIPDGDMHTRSHELPIPVRKPFFLFLDDRRRHSALSRKLFKNCLIVSIKLPEIHWYPQRELDKLF